jgi:hypothetical protein
MNEETVKCNVELRVRIMTFGLTMWMWLAGK